MQLKLGFIAIALTITCAPTALGQSCSFGMTDIDFGSVNLGLSGVSPTTGTFTASCTGTPNSKITICPNLGDGTGGSLNGNPRYLKQGNKQISYGIFQESGNTQIWGSYVWPYTPRPPVLTLTLNGSGNGTLSRTVYARLSGIATAPGNGTYQSQYSGGHTLIDYGYEPAQSCTVVSARATRAPFVVRVQNNSSCNVSTTDMDFGNQTSLAVDRTAINSIAVTCTPGVQYTVGMSNGSSGGTSPINRLMAKPATTQKITYGIYRNAARTQQWGATIGTNTTAGVGTGVTQNYTAYGRIPAQTTPPAGSYSDVVVVTVTY